MLGKQLLYCTLALPQIPGDVCHSHFSIKVCFEKIQNLFYVVGHIHTIDHIALTHFLGNHICVPAELNEKYFQQVFGHLTAAKGASLYLFQPLQQRIVGIHQPEAGQTFFKEHGKQAFFLRIQPEYLPFKILHSPAAALEGNNTHIGCHRIVSGEIVVLIGLVKGHLSAF